jgi:hypothetical protein
MSAFTKHLRSSMVVAGVAAMTLIPIASPSVLAACAGTGNPSASASAWGYEAASNLTCDNLGDYNGIYRDTLTDGLQVRIRTRWINGSSAWSYTGYTNGLNVNYYVGYWDNDKSTQFQIGRSDGVYATQGSNWGF